MIVAAIAGSVIDSGSRKICNAASESVIECAMVKAVTILTTGHSRRAHKITATRKQMWS